jgi:cystathionine beta-lyase/cystathionine gamma-synthase
MKQKKTLGIDTLAVHGLSDKAEVGKPSGITVPFSCSWVLPPSGDGGLSHDYGRVGTELTLRLEDQVSALEEGKFCVVFSSGITALNAVLLTLQQGDSVVCQSVCYGNTIRLLRAWEKFGIRTHFLDLTDSKSTNSIAQIRPALVMIESPSNPLLDIISIKKVSDTAHSVGAKVLVDNSCATSWNQKPLTLGADLSVVSLTKYYNGHSTGMGGAVIVNDQDLYDSLLISRKTFGLQPGSMECAFTIQGIQTLPIRMERIGNSALQIAKFLDEHPKISKVYYPYLSSHPQYNLALEQMRSGSGVISIELSGTRDSIDTFTDNLAPLFSRAHSFGSVKSQVSVPAKMSHAAVDSDELANIGVSSNLIRLSIGLEDPFDLISTLSDALSLIPDATK